MASGNGSHPKKKKKPETKAVKMAKKKRAKK